MLHFLSSMLPIERIQYRDTFFSLWMYLYSMHQFYVHIMQCRPQPRTFIVPFFFGLKLTRMSRPLRSLTLVQRLSTARCHHALRPSHPSLHLRCGGLAASCATQAHEQVHPHHLPAKKPSVFGQPTSKSHPHLGEQHPCVRHPPPPLPLALVCVWPIFVPNIVR